MNGLSRAWIAPDIRGRDGIYWCAGWYGFAAVACLAVSVFENGVAGFSFLLLAGALHAYAALGLLRGLKPAWHVAAFLAFVTLVTRLVATACAPGEIADGDRHLFEAAIDIVVLAIAITVFRYLRKPSIRRLYGVPESYRNENPQQE